MPTESAPLDHQAIEVDPPPPYCRHPFQGVIHGEALSVTQELQNTAPATSIPTSVEIGPVDAVNDRVVVSKSPLSSVFPFVASQYTTRGQQFVLRPPVSCFTSDRVSDPPAR